MGWLENQLTRVMLSAAKHLVIVERDSSLRSE